MGWAEEGRVSLGEGMASGHAKAQGQAGPGRARGHQVVALAGGHNNGGGVRGRELQVDVLAVVVDVKAGLGHGARVRTTIRAFDIFLSRGSGSLSFGIWDFGNLTSKNVPQA